MAPSHRRDHRELSVFSFPKAQSVADLLLQRIAATPNQEAFLQPEGEGWKKWTWRQFGDRVRAVACGLRSLGLQPEDRVAILSSTRLEWIIADSGVLCAGGATSTIYPSNTPEEAAYILQDSGARFVFAENAEQVTKLVAKKSELPGIVKVITFDRALDHGGWVIPLEELERRGEAAHQKDPQAYERIAKAIGPQQLATLIYTSGTTGRPKGVELVHDCWLYESQAVEELHLLRPDDVQYLWLPLSHVFGKVLQVSQFRSGFRTAVDGRVDRLMESLGQVKPTFVAAVPRIFEKIYNKVVGGAKQAGGAKWAIFQWALRVGRERSAALQAGRPPGLLNDLQHAVAQRLVYSKLQQRFGGRLRFFVSGSAPLSRQMSEFFHSMGILICEGYGLTESSAASCVNLPIPGKYRFGSVGYPMPETQVQLAPADGEILIKGRGVMRGYRGLPAETAEALDAEGWLHTGDIGEWDADGFLRITDRKKDLIKTSVGKYVAPQHLEGRFKALCPYASQMLVHGNNRNFVSALIALDPEAIGAWARESNLGQTEYAKIVAHEKTRALLKQFVEQLNAGLASYERIGKFAILPADLTLETGELTPSLKVKRKVVETKYKALLDGFYTSALDG
jgi:long-chain acyl-CoA synthetase